MNRKYPPLGRCCSGPVPIRPGQAGDGRRAGRRRRDGQPRDVRPAAAAHLRSRQAQLPPEPLEHHEELHRQGPVQDTDAGQLQRAAQHAAAADGGLRVRRDFGRGCEVGESGVGSERSFIFGSER